MTDARASSVSPQAGALGDDFVSAVNARGACVRGSVSTRRVGCRRGRASLRRHLVARRQCRRARRGGDRAADFRSSDSAPPSALLPVWDVRAPIFDYGPLGLRVFRRDLGAISSPARFGPLIAGDALCDHILSGHLRRGLAVCGDVRRAVVGVRAIDLERVWLVADSRELAFAREWIKVARAGLVAGREQTVHDPFVAGAATSARVDEARAASIVQRCWRARRGRAQAARDDCSCSPCIVAPIEDWWDAARARRLGPLVAHVRFLQFVFRGTRALGQRWVKGGLRGSLVALRLLWRSTGRRRCGGGRNLAGPAEFEAQAALARRMLGWYDLYAAILRRLESGDAPSVVHLFCGAGGDAEAFSAQLLRKADTMSAKMLG